jgi:hypothetical protein
MIILLILLYPSLLLVQITFQFLLCRRNLIKTLIHFSIMHVKEKEKDKLFKDIDDDDTTS